MKRQVSNHLSEINCKFSTTGIIFDMPPRRNDRVRHSPFTDAIALKSQSFVQDVDPPLCHTSLIDSAYQITPRINEEWTHLIARRTNDTLRVDYQPAAFRR